MIVVGLFLLGLAALIHVYVFYLESLAWERPSTRRTFDIRTDAQVEATKVLAFNQGFYNLFLAVATGLGIAFIVSGDTTVGSTLVYVGAGSMVLAGVVLLFSRRSAARAAVIQLTPPLLGIVTLAVGFAVDAS